MKYTINLDHGNGITGKYQVEAANKTEARKNVPNKRKIVSIVEGWPSKQSNS